MTPLLPGSKPPRKSAKLFGSSPVALPEIVNRAGPPTTRKPMSANDSPSAWPKCACVLMVGGSSWTVASEVMLPDTSIFSGWLPPPIASAWKTVPAVASALSPPTTSCAASGAAASSNWNGSGPPGKSNNSSSWSLAAVPACATVLAVVNPPWETRLTCAPAAGTERSKAVNARADTRTTGAMSMARASPVGGIQSRRALACESR